MEKRSIFLGNVLREQILDITKYMLEKFLDKKFGQAALQRIAQVNQILDEYKAMGYSLSLRQVFYQLVSRDMLANSQENYKSLGDIVSDGRLAGMIDWAMIVDRGREVQSLPHWDAPADILQQATNQFRLDKWKDQPNYVEVMVEKQALEGILLPVCQRLDIPFTSNKGFSSSSAMYDAGKRMQERRDLGGKAIHVVYLGDHDPSGVAMSDDVLGRLTLFSNGLVEVHRVALNMDQIERYNPPENPVKLTDSRAKAYTERFGHSSWELDSLRPDVLADTISTAVLGLRDERRWSEAMAREEELKEEMQDLVDAFQG